MSVKVNTAVGLCLTIAILHNDFFWVVFESHGIACFVLLTLTASGYKDLPTFRELQIHTLAAVQ